MTISPPGNSHNRIPIGGLRQLLAVGVRGIARASHLWNRVRRHPGSEPGRKSAIILEPFGLGDMIHLEPLVRALSRGGWEVKICGKAQWQPVMDGMRNVTWIPAELPWADYSEERKYRSGRYLDGRFREFLRRFRKAAQGSVGMDLRGDLRSVALLNYAGCRKVFTLERYHGTDLEVGGGVADWIVPEDDDLRCWETGLKFLHGLNDPALEQIGKFAPPDLRHLLPPNYQLTSEKAAGLAPIAPWPGRLWAAASWIKLVERLRHDGWRVIGLCGPNQAVEARAFLGDDVPIAESQSLAGWAENFARCRVAIVLDSGPLHLADALGLPLVGLYGAGKLPLWSPSGDRAVALHHQEAPDFYPLHQVKAHIQLGQIYMNRITVGEVLAAIDRIGKSGS